jgi:hypothetical protein
VRTMPPLFPHLPRDPSPPPCFLLLSTPTTTPVRVWDLCSAPLSTAPAPIRMPSSPTSPPTAVPLKPGSFSLLFVGAAFVTGASRRSTAFLGAETLFAVLPVGGSVTVDGHVSCPP